MKTKSQYSKDTKTDVGWIDNVPDGWGVVRLDTVFRQKKEYSTQNEELLSVYRDHGVIPKSSRDDNHNKPSEDLSKYILVKPDDLVINKMKTWQGSIAISQYRGIVSPAYFTFKPIRKDGIFLPYLHHLLRSSGYIKTYQRISNGIRPQQWDLDPYQFKILPLLIPPLKTQQHIADFLDERTKKIDELVAKKERLIELLKEKRIALITRAVTKGLDSKAKMKPSGVEWRGDIPEGWEMKKLKYCLSLINKKSETTENTIALENIEGGTGRFIETDGKYEGGTAFQKDDILFGKLRPYLAKVFLPKEKGNAIGDILVYRATKGIFPKFAFYSFLYDGFLDVVDSSTYGSKMPRADSFFIGNLMFIYPSQSEQKQISGFLDYEFQKNEKTTDLIVSQIEKLKEYRRSLIYSAVTGKIKI